MGWLIFIGIIIFVIWASNKETNKSDRNRNNPNAGQSDQSTSRNNQNTGTIYSNNSKPKTSYRPSSTGVKRNIVFNDVSQTFNSSEKPNLSGLMDAFTGAELNPALGLYQCKNCTVYYHTQSYEVLREANNGSCVSCSSNNIHKVTFGEESKGKNFNPDVITLDNFKQYVGRVVTFEGYVPNVLESRRGNDYAVMFQNTSWAKGFKLIFFRGAIQAVGGKRYIMSLKGKTVRVRGLLINHPKFGYEIIVSEKSMILDVK